MADSSIVGRVRRLWADHPFDILFVLLVAMVFSGPFHTLGAGTLSTVIAALLPPAAIIALGSGRHTVRLALLLGLPAMAAIVQEDLGVGLVPLWVAMIFPLAIYVLVTWIIVRRVLEDPVVGRTTIVGALSGYLMLGYVWSIAYAVALEFEPHAFRGTHGSDGSFAPGEGIYYSFVTLSTLGYGDIVPLTPLARSLSILQSITGVLYLAVLVASIVGGARQRS